MLQQLINNTAITIRNACIDDCDELNELEQQLFDYDRISKRSLRHLLQSETTAFICVAQCDSLIIGYLIFLSRKNSNMARLYSIGVLSEFRGQNIARTLIYHGMNAMSSRGIDRLSLEVKPNNQSAIKLYESMGFQRVKVIPSYYSDGDDAYRYVLTKDSRREKILISNNITHVN